MMGFLCYFVGWENYDVGCVVVVVSEWYDVGDCFGI